MAPMYLQRRAKAKLSKKSKQNKGHPAREKKYVKLIVQNASGTQGTDTPREKGFFFLLFFFALHKQTNGLFLIVPLSLVVSHEVLTI